MPGFTIKIDTSQLVEGADKASGKLKEVGVNLKIVSKDAHDATGSLGGTADALSGMVRRITALVGAYKSLQGVLSFVRRGMDFNASIEASQIAIASVIAATNKLSTSEGRVLEGAEKFNAAQELSKGMMEEIQVMALQTTATFDSLAEGVAGVIAPATKAGVELEKMPKFAVAAAQAMTTMKIPLQQMRTEIEAVLTGNINRAQDQLATNLGITREMVKSWQEQGTLVDNLMSKFEAFVIAGDRVADSWSGLKGNMEDALDYISGKTGRGIFEGAKQSYRELLQLMVSTEGKVGVGKDIENIVEMVEALQTKIGIELVEVTRAFIEKVKELNNPENIGNLIGKMNSLKDKIVETAGHLASIGRTVQDILTISLNGWNSMPDVIKELGLIGGLAFGIKGKIAILSLGIAMQTMKEAINVAKFYSSIPTDVNPEDEEGYDRLLQLARERQQKLNEQLEQIRKEQEEEARKRGENIKNALGLGDFSWNNTSGNNGTGKDSKPSGGIKTESTIGGAGKDKDNKNVLKSLDSAKEKITRLREEIARLNGESAGDGLAKKLREIEKMGASAKLSKSDVEALKKEYKDAFQKKTLDDFDKALLQAQGNTKALKDLSISESVHEWTGRLTEAGLSAEEASKKALMLGEALRNQETVQSLETVNSVLKELEEKTGQYGISIDTTNKLIEKQVKIWRQAGVPEEYIEQLREIRRLESSRDAWDGMLLGTREYFSSASNMAEGFKSTVTQAFSGMEDAITEACMTGKVSFSDMINSMIKDLIRLMVRQSVTAPIANGILGFFGGGTSTAATTNASSFNFAKAGGVGSSQALSFIPGVAHTGGMAESLSRYSSPVPASLFAYAPRFHAGSGYIRPGEYPAILKRGERVLNPAETRAYQQGQQVNVNIVNSTGQSAQARTRTDNFGNKTIDVYVGDMAAKQLSTPGSTLNRAVSAQTGTSRPAVRR